MTDLFNIGKNGTLTHLRGLIPGEPEKDILFPQQLVVVEGVIQLRGGAPVYCPIFGEMPQNSTYYAGINLPRHGLVRRSTRQKNFLIYTGKQIASFCFDSPWKHSVDVSGSTEDSKFVHELEVHHNNPELPEHAAMPLSAAFHTYVATHGEPFKIYYGDFSLTSKQIIHGESLFAHGTGDPDDALQIVFPRYTVEFYIEEMYKHFCFWTDNIAKYISAEPFFGRKYSDPYLLKNFSKCMGRCTISVR